MAVEVQWSDGQRVGPAEGARGREHEVEADVCRARAGERRDQGCAQPKTVGPSAKRAAIALLVDEHGLPVTRACRGVRLSRTAFYEPPPARALQAVVVANGRWGFWKCFDQLRLDEAWWNPKP